MRYLSLILLLCLGLSACGQKGDLYLPDEEQTPQQEQQQPAATEQQQNQ